MTRSRNPRRVYDADGHEIEPMTLSDMRARDPLRLGVLHNDRLQSRGVRDCRCLPDELPVPDVALRLRCLRCGRRSVTT
jgi:hypothetical protein